MDFKPLKDFMDRLACERVPGNSVSVYIDNKEVFSHCAGFADKETGEKMTLNKHFYIYSCSKVTTAVAAMQLYERGYFLLDDPIYEYIPEFLDMYVVENGKTVKADKPITFRHLFTMTAGISYENNADFATKMKELSGGNGIDNLGFAKAIAQRPLSFQPGTHWQYSFCHDLLASLVEVISGMKFRDYVKKNIFEPLLMDSSCYHPTPEIEKNLATQYRFYETTSEDDLVELQKSDRSGILGCVKKTDQRNVYIFGPEFDSGGAGIVTTVPDYVKLVSALANGGKGASGERILSPAAIELMRQNQLSPEVMPDLNWPQLKGYGYGLGVRTLIDKAKGGSPSSLGEFGWGGAAGATVLCDPDKHLAMFYTHYMLNPQEYYYQPRLRNVLYACID